MYIYVHSITKVPYSYAIISLTKQLKYKCIYITSSEFCKLKTNILIGNKQQSRCYLQKFLILLSKHVATCINRFLSCKRLDANI